MTTTERSTADLQATDRAHVWHPFTPMEEWNQGVPLAIARADGNYLYDTDGRRYLDGVSSLWTIVHGHNRREINDAIAAQLARVAHSTLLGLTHPPAIELAERLVSLAPPGLNHVFYSDSGSTATEVALKIAFQYWHQNGSPQRTRFIALDGAYHGDTLGAVAVGGLALFHQIYRPLLCDVLRALSPATVGREAALAALEDLLATRRDEVAAMILEPLVQGAAGMLVHPPGYLRGVADLCRRHDVFLVVDEVATGFGRTGTLFACEQEGVAPDLLCLAKGLTGGYLPLAATLATDRLFNGFLGKRSEARTFFHGHTFTGNPLACAAALASLRLFETDRVLERLPGTIAQLADLLAREIAPLACVGAVRQRGLMVGVELTRSRAEGDTYPPELAMGHQVCAAIRRRGVILRPLGDVVVLMPPLSIGPEEVNLLVRALRDTLLEVCR